jgi:hypothetical protein
MCKSAPLTPFPISLPFRCSVSGFGDTLSNVNRGRWIWWLLLGCGGVVLLAVFTFMDPQPSYRGRSLTTWLMLYRSANLHFPTDPEPAQALRQMGPRALPYLLAWLPDERPAWKNRVLSALNSVPAPAHTVSTNLSRKLRMEWERREAGYRMSIWGFGVLGPAARPAAAQLGRLALNGTGKAADRAARALLDMGTNAEPALPLLLSSLRSARQPGATRAVWLLGALQGVASASVPPLITTLEDSNPEVRVLAMRALGRLGEAAAPAVPALLKVSHEPLNGAEAQSALTQIPSFAIGQLLEQFQTGSPEAKQRAINALGDLGARGRLAVPALLAAAEAQPAWAGQITNALRSLAPELVWGTTPSWTGR